MAVFSNKTIRPAPRRASCEAMLVPVHPPPITTTSALSATDSDDLRVGKRRRVLTDEPSQALVFGWRRLFEEAAPADGGHAGSGEVGPHLGQLEAGQHTVNDGRARRTVGAVTSMG